MSKKIEDRAYIQSKLDEILKPMLTKMFVANPADPVSKTTVLLIIEFRSNSCKTTSETTMAADPPTT